MAIYGLLTTQCGKCNADIDIDVDGLNGTTYLSCPDCDREYSIEWNVKIDGNDEADGRALFA
jgi:hypothetical protein